MDAVAYTIEDGEKERKVHIAWEDGSVTVVGLEALRAMRRKRSRRVEFEDVLFAVADDMGDAPSTGRVDKRFTPATRTRR